MALWPIIDVAAYRGAVWAEDGSIFVGAHPNVVRIPPAGGPPETIAEAQARVYQAMTQISFAGMHYRRDIGHHAIRQR